MNNYFYVGAGKTASSSVWQYFWEHPNLNVFAERSEPNYFCEEIKSKYDDHDVSKAVMEFCDAKNLDCETGFHDRWIKK